MSVKQNAPESLSDEIHRLQRYWPVVVVPLVIGVMYSILSDNVTLGPGWLLLIIIVVLVVAIEAARLKKRPDTLRRLALAVAGVTTVALTLSAILLIRSIALHRLVASTLLGDAMVVWTTTIVVFAFWYWLIDGGGPIKRHHESLIASDFVFPQNQLTPPITDWTPLFIDYLFLSFNVSTAFSPTDTPVLTRRAKVLMMVQSSLSLVVLAVLAARAINIF